MAAMQDTPSALPLVRLVGPAQIYVATVAALAIGSMVGNSGAWHVALVVLALPLSLLALWVSFYAGLAVGFVLGHDPAQFSWPVALVWVAVWTVTAWINAQLVQKVLRSGWAAVGRKG